MGTIPPDAAIVSTHDRMRMVAAAIDRARDQQGRKLSAGVRMTAIVLASYANLVTGEAYPSQATLQAITGRSRATVQRDLDRLVEAGIVARRTVPGRPAVYVFGASAPDAGADPAPIGNRFGTRREPIRNASGTANPPHGSAPTTVQPASLMDEAGVPHPNGEAGTRLTGNPPHPCVRHEKEDVAVAGGGAAASGAAPARTRAERAPALARDPADLDAAKIAKSIARTLNARREWWQARNDRNIGRVSAPDLVGAVSDALAAGHDEEMIRRYIGNLPTPKSSAHGFVRSALERLLTIHPEVLGAVQTRGGPATPVAPSGPEGPPEPASPPDRPGAPLPPPEVVLGLITVEEPPYDPWGA